MYYNYGGWAPYVSVAQRQDKAEKQIKALRKKGVVISPVTITGRKIAKTFWGTAWCDNLERYRDYANRLERGRSYVRNGLVLDLQIAPREITAMVSGSELYTVKITITNVAKTHWKQLCADCSGGIDSLVELLQGRFSKAVMTRLCEIDTGLFPRPKEIRFKCSCPDHASMCKHVAAALYGVGARLDESPELLFKLRAVEAAELLGNLGNALPAAKAPTALAGADLAALFDLEMADDEINNSPPPPKPAQKIVAKLPAEPVTPAAKPRRKPTGTTKPAKATTKVKPKAPAPLKTAKRQTAPSKPKSAAKKLAKQPTPNSLTRAHTAKVSAKTKTVRKALKNNKTAHPNTAFS
jgi:uncharacterized Zn finger protein